MSDQFIGVDVGGTKIATAVLEGGELTESEIVHTEQGSQAALLEQLGAAIEASKTPDTRAVIKLALWSPGTTEVEGLRVDLKRRVAQSRSVGTQARFAYRAPVTGLYYIQAKLVTRALDPVQYQLSLVRGK